MGIVYAVILIALGAFSLAGAVRNWDWFMNNYKARHLVDAFGRNVARIIYGFIGVFLIVIGILFIIASF
ncbi:MAG: immunity 17 family protein [Ruminococcus sp.]|nr:immunity 17 family protein [Ruminococcus sp.]